jgi:hypothetical protein
LPLTAGGGGGGAFCEQALRRAEAATRVRIAIFMCFAWVLTVLLWFPSTRLLVAGFFEINDKFYLCKQPNHFVVKMTVKNTVDAQPHGPLSPRP